VPQDGVAGDRSGEILSERRAVVGLVIRQDHFLTRDHDLTAGRSGPAADTVQVPIRIAEGFVIAGHRHAGVKPKGADYIDARGIRKVDEVLVGAGNRR